MTAPTFKQNLFQRTDHQEVQQFVPQNFDSFEEEI